MKTQFTNSVPLFCLFASLMVLLASCQEHQLASPANPKFRISKMVAEGGNQENATTIYSYNSNNQLSRIRKAYTIRAKGNNVDIYYTSILTYNAQGQVTSLENQFDNTAYITSRYTYEYDGKGNPVTIRYTLYSSASLVDPNSSQTIRAVYPVNSKFPSSVTSVSDVFGEGSTYTYTYAGNNAVTIKKSTPGTSLSDFNYTRTYQFDDKPNPFYGLYPGVPDPDLFFRISYNTFYENNVLNRNNMISPELINSYDAFGNLVKETGNGFTRTYEYEQY